VKMYVSDPAAARSRAGARWSVRGARRRLRERRRTTVWVNFPTQKSMPLPTGCAGTWSKGARAVGGYFWRGTRPIM